MTGHPNAFLRVLRGEALTPPPIWFMRQAGRYLPEYRAVREEAGSFLELCYNPELAARVTLQPIERFDLDAAILFADILLIPEAMGMQLTFAAGEGPRLAPTVRDEGLKFLASDRSIHSTLNPVYETVARVRDSLAETKALIGFAGAPWTVATYMLAGRGTKDPSALRAFAYREPETFDQLIERLTAHTTEYLSRQIEAGVDAVQIFDSWATGLPEPFFDRYCKEPVFRIAEELKRKHGVPVIAFPRGAGPLYRSVAANEAIDGVSIDTGLPAEWAAQHLATEGTVQGGLDPLLVVAGGKPMFAAADALLDAFKGKRYIFNLGHGFVPETPPENVAALVKHIRER
jgi:uroporphyrinogen decarboxylase